MSVSCEVYVGYTIEIETNLSHADFKKIHEFEDKYPEVDKYNHHCDDYEGRVLLIADGMCSDFARLIYVDKYIDGGSLGDSNEYFELAQPASTESDDKISKLRDYYFKYTGKSMADYVTETQPKIKYAMWSLWG